MVIYRVELRVGGIHARLKHVSIHVFTSKNNQEFRLRTLNCMGHTIHRNLTHPRPRTDEREVRKQCVDTRPSILQKIADTSSTFSNSLKSKSKIAPKYYCRYRASGRSTGGIARTPSFRNPHFFLGVNIVSQYAALLYLKYNLQTRCPQFPLTPHTQTLHFPPKTRKCSRRIKKGHRPHNF